MSKAWSKGFSPLVNEQMDFCRLQQGPPPHEIGIAQQNELNGKGEQVDEIEGGQ